MDDVHKVNDYINIPPSRILKSELNKSEMNWNFVCNVSIADTVIVFLDYNLFYMSTLISHHVFHAWSQQATVSLVAHIVPPACQ
jgi:hypothetical protein